MTNRREFLTSCAAAITGLPRAARNVLASDYFTAEAAKFSDPGINLVRDGVEAAQKGKNNNITPVLREEILDNPKAVFVIRTNVVSKQLLNGQFPPEKEQMERVGYETANKIFRKGTMKGGTTYIQPNFVWFKSDGDFINNGISTHPSFVAGFCDALKEAGNTNILVGANGAARHEDFVGSGVAEMMNNHGAVLVEGRYKSYRDYVPSEIAWFDYPEGVVMRKIPFFNPIKEKDTTFINMAKTRIHNLAVTTLTAKNMQGTMPVGYMHICNTWPDGLKIPMSLQPDRQIFNPDYQKVIEQLYVKHANERYKHWDEGGFAKEYFDAGGWKTFQDGLQPNFLLFRCEQWAQRIMDVDSNITPYVNMVEGVFGIDGQDKVYLNNFITISKSMIACDAVTTWLMGHDPRELYYLRIANERGMGQNDIEKIDIFNIADKGIEKIKDYRSLPRAHMGVIMHNLKGGELRFF